MFKKILKSIFFLLFIVAIVIGYKYINEHINNSNTFENFAFGNGRIESTQINIATKIPGRLVDVYVEEGEIVQKGQMLAKLDTDELEARLRLAQAQIEEAEEGKNHALAILEQRKSELSLAKENFLRAQTLYKKNAISLLTYQQEETSYKSAKAAMKAAETDIARMQATITSAVAQADSIKVNIKESTLYAPTEGRILYKLSQKGEVIGSGQNVLVLLDLLDTYMTIFLPTSAVGVIDYGSESRVVLDALPDIAIPAKVTFISPKAQFTPKQIETQDERAKLMFRVKVTIDYNLLKKYIQKVKTGLPGVAYIRLDETAPWPKSLSNLPKSYLKSSN